MPGATDMMVEADHLVGLRHHQMQIVRHHQNAAAPLIADTGDKPEKIRLPGDVNSLRGFVED